MADYIEIDLMPIGIKNQMRVIKKVGTCAVMFAFALSAVMWATGYYYDVLTGIVFSLVLFLIAIPLLLPGLKFDKVSQSKVRFTADQIRILDKKGTCWRTIDYCIITDVHIEEISGFFYGANKDMFRNKYVCLFLNGSINKPDAPFAKLFTEKDFVMFGYNAEALQQVYQKCLQ